MGKSMDPENRKTIEHMASSHGMIVDESGNGVVADEVASWNVPQFRNDDHRKDCWTQVNLRNGSVAMVHLPALEFIRLLAMTRPESVTIAHGHDDAQN